MKRGNPPLRKKPEHGTQRLVITSAPVQQSVETGTSGRQKLSTRNIGIDLLRVISVIAVVLGHAWPFMPGEEFLQIWRMPLFFFLAGFFLSSSRTLRVEFTIRWRTLGIPYLVWLAVLSTLVLVHHFTPWPFENTWGILAGALFGGGLTDMPYLAFWFISVLFFALLWVRILLKLPWPLQLAAAVSGFALAKIPHSAMSFTALGIGLVPACAAYILAGYWFRRLFSATSTGQRVTGERVTKDHVADHAVAAEDMADLHATSQPTADHHTAVHHPARAHLPAMAAIWPGILGIGLVATGISAVALGAGTMNMKWSGFGTFLLSPLLAVTICIGLILTFGTWVDAALRALPGGVAVVSELVRTGTLVVFFHAYMLFILWDLLPWPPGRVVIAVVICWSLGALINRTRLSPYLTGLPRRSHR